MRLKGLVKKKKIPALTTALSVSVMLVVSDMLLMLLLLKGFDYGNQILSLPSKIENTSRELNK